MTTIFISPHKKISYLFAALTIVVLTITIAGLIQQSYRVNILVYSKRHRLEINFTDTVKAQILQETLSGEKTATPQTIATMDDFAIGEVIIINNSSQNQTLVANTRLLSADKKLFHLSARVVVLAKQKVKAKVRADKPGADYDIPPTTFSIPGLSSILQTKIYAESQEAMSGGFKKVGLITQKDIDDAITALNNELKRQALANLEKKNNDPNLSVALRSDIISSSADAKANDEKDQFTVKLTVKTTAALVKEDDLLKTMNDQLAKQVPGDEKLATIEQSSFAYRLQSFDTDAQTAAIQMYLAGEAILSENNNLLAKVYFTGKTKNEIKNYLQNIEEVDNYKITFSPFFIKKSPGDEKRINIKVI